MVDVDAYSSEVGKLSDLVLQQRAQLLILNEFKELVLAKQTERALAVLDGRPQVLCTYVPQLRGLLTTSIATTVSF